MILFACILLIFATWALAFALIDPVIRRWPNHDTLPLLGLLLIGNSGSFTAILLADYCA